MSNTAKLEKHIFIESTFSDRRKVCNYATAPNQGCRRRRFAYPDQKEQTCNDELWYLKVGYLENQ